MNSPSVGESFFINQMTSTARSSSIIAMVDYHCNGPGPPKAKTPFGPRAEIACVDICLRWLLLFLFSLETKLENNDRQSLFLEENQNLKDYEIARKALRRMIDRLAEYRTHSTTEHVKGDAEAEELAHDAVDDNNGDADWQAAGNPPNPHDPMATTCHPAVATRVGEDWVKGPVGNVSHTPRLCARLAWPRSQSRMTFAPNPNPNPKSPRTVLPVGIHVPQTFRLNPLSNGAPRPKLPLQITIQAQGSRAL